MHKPIEGLLLLGLVIAGCDGAAGVGRVLLNGILPSADDAGQDLAEFTPVAVQNNTLDLAEPGAADFPSAFDGDDALPVSGFHFTSSDFFIWFRVP